MGYSVAIRCRTKKLRDEMFRFMDEHFDHPCTIMPEIDQSAIRPNEKDKQNVSRKLEYDQGKIALGFDYSSWLSGPERFYLFSVIRWMALKIGRKRHWKEFGTKPHYVYDGYETCPIFAEEQAPHGYTQCDSLGISHSTPLFRNECEIFNMDPHQTRKTVRKAILRLEQAWNEAHQS